MIKNIMLIILLMITTYLFSDSQGLVTTGLVNGVDTSVNTIKINITNINESNGQAGFAFTNVKVSVEGYSSDFCTVPYQEIIIPQILSMQSVEPEITVIVNSNSPTTVGYVRIKIESLDSGEVYYKIVTLHTEPQKNTLFVLNRSDPAYELIPQSDISPGLNIAFRSAKAIREAIQHSKDGDKIGLIKFNSVPEKIRNGFPDVKLFNWTNWNTDFAINTSDIKYDDLFWEKRKSQLGNACIMPSVTGTHDGTSYTTYSLKNWTYSALMGSTDNKSIFFFSPLLHQDFLGYINSTQINHSILPNVINSAYENYQWLTANNTKFYPIVSKYLPNLLFSIYPEVPGGINYPPEVSAKFLYNRHNKISYGSKSNLL